MLVLIPAYRGEPFHDEVLACYLAPQGYQSKSDSVIP